MLNLNLCPDILIISTFLLSFFLSFYSIPSIIKIVKAKNLYDEPEKRSVHTENVPTLGGLAIYIGFFISVLLFTDVMKLPEIKYISVSVAIMFFIGMKDDILIIDPGKKLIGQTFAALIIVLFADIRITHFHGFFGIEYINDYFSIALSVFLILTIINSFNFIDGIDGLAGSIGIVILSSFGTWFYLTGHYQYVIISFGLVGSVLAFLRYNMFCKTCKIFMGDTGSLIMGTVVSVLAIQFNEFNINHDFEYSKWAAPAISFAILVIPLFDLLRILFIRFLQGRKLFEPDKQHIHHLLLKLGLSHKIIVLILVLVNIFFIFLGFYFHNFVGIRTLLLFLLLLAMIIFYIPVIINDRKS